MIDIKDAMIAVVTRATGSGRADSLQLFDRSSLAGVKNLVKDSGVVKVMIYEVTAVKLVGQHELTAETQGILVDLVK